MNINKLADVLSINALECANLSLEVFTDAGYVEPPRTSNKCHIRYLSHIPNIATLLFHLNNSNCYALDESGLLDVVDSDTLIELNYIINDVSELPKKIRLVWETTHLKKDVPSEIENNRR